MTHMCIRMLSCCIWCSEEGVGMAQLFSFHAKFNKKFLKNVKNGVRCCMPILNDIKTNQQAVMKEYEFNYVNMQSLTAARHGHITRLQSLNREQTSQYLGNFLLVCSLL